MPRHTRKQLVDPCEEQVHIDREEFYRRLEIQLHHEWREHRTSRNDTLSSGILPEVEAYQSVL